MADIQNISSAKTNTFHKGMVKDNLNIFVGEGIYTHAINAINRTHNGDLGGIGNEPSNRLCDTATYDIIGYAHIEKTRWVIFSTDDTNSEIGIFEESNCSYTVLVNDTCLNFNKTYLITAVVKANYDCTFSVYWQDNNNPDRVMNIDNIPYKTHLVPPYDPAIEQCYEHILDTPLSLDCEALRLHPLITQPCITSKRGDGNGQFINGSYMACVAYSQNGIRLTDYSIPSLPQGLWEHTGIGGSLEINIENLDQDFEEYELVIISIVAQQTVAKKIGYYSIRQSKVVLDIINASLPTIDLAQIPLKSVIYEKSEKMFGVNGYLIRTGVTIQPYVNYQPLANKIRAEWVAVRYPMNYYWEGGNKTNNMRDEVYPYFIRWIYNTGARTASYHIPGRSKIIGSDDIPMSSDPLSPDYDAQTFDGETEKWQVYDTSEYHVASGTLDDGGEIIAKGRMAYWESEEKYPDDNYEVWEDLCGKNIRHHKMPSDETIGIHENNQPYIYILGVQFSNIKPPEDINGQIIQDIVGYEILRGSREGNRSIIAKGIFNNMWWFPLKNASNNTALDRKGLYQNYPYNDLREDYLLTPDYTSLEFDQEATGSNYNDKINNTKPMGYPYGESTEKGGYLKNFFSFHSPETTFAKPYLGTGVYVSIYRNEVGSVLGKFELPYKHPKFKLVTDTTFLIACAVGVGIGLLAALGKSTTTQMNTSTTGTIDGASAPIATLVTYDYAYGRGSEKEIGSSITGIIANLTQTTINQPSSISAIIANITEFAAKFIYFAGAGTNEALGIMKSIIKYRDYALQYNSHGHYARTYNVSGPIGKKCYRRKLNTNGAKYIGSGVQDFNSTYIINNLNRNKYVAINTETSIPNPTIHDITRMLLKEIAPTDRFFEKPYDYGYIPNKLITFGILNTPGILNTTSAYYGALKVHNRSQYGQLSSIIQLPISCVFDVSMKTSPVIFGGDTYINRYTEKNPYMFFNTWLFDVLDGTEFNYTNYINGPVPKYWANFNAFDVEDFNITATTEPVLGINVPTGIALLTPSDMHRLQRLDNMTGFSAVKDAWFYLFYNGVRDFYCESEFNLAYRDYGEKSTEKFYDPYGLSFSDLSTMFRSDLIREMIYYKYDLSLSASKLFSNFSTWGTILPRDYMPSLYNTCFQYYPKRAIYSLPQQEGMKRDNWRNFLPLNYKDFNSKISVIKSLNGTGALILFEDIEPKQFVGIDQFQTTGGVKITIGDGGLFQQNMQGIVNADDVLQYGTCTSSRSAVNTPHGL